MSEQFLIIIPNIANVLFFISDTRALNNSLKSNKIPISLIKGESCKLMSHII